MTYSERETHTSHCEEHITLCCTESHTMMLTCTKAALFPRPCTCTCLKKIKRHEPHSCRIRF